MKIVQTFWSGNTQQNPLQNKAGWLSPEYHWMSWALSSLQFSKFYGSLNLVTDALGKQVLIDIFGLPYNEIHAELDILNRYSPKLWALAKIYAYSLQVERHPKEPFIHVDGDIYIWERFDERINNAQLIAQNVEVDFAYYYKSMAEVKEHFAYIPEPILAALSENPVIRSCNTGIIGGHNLAIFKEYTELSLAFIDNNIEHLEKIDMPTFNIAFEQLLYYSLAKYRNIPVECFIENEENFDPTYTGFARFECVPYQTKFIHALGDFKRNAITCQHLAKRLRKDYPIKYYHILKTCQESEIILHNKAYHLPELSPIFHDFAYFLHLKDHFNTCELKSWQYFYGKDMAVYAAVEVLFSLPIEELLKQILIFDSDAEIIEEMTDAVLKQSLKVANVQTLSYDLYELDSLGMVLYDTFLEEKSIIESIKEISIYFPKEEIEADYPKFQNLVLDRIKVALYLGGIKIC